MPGQNSGFPFLDILNEDPRLAYYAQLYGGGGQGLNPLQQGHFQGQYGDVYSRYLGQVGQGLVGAQQKGQSLADYAAQPQQSFYDYLQNMPFTQRWDQTPKELRPGNSQSRFSPQTRWMV